MAGYGFTITTNNIQVNMSSRNMKKLALFSLKGRWPQALLVALIFTFLNRLPIYISDMIEPAEEGFSPAYFAVNIFAIAITGALTLSTCSYFLSVFRQQPAAARQLAFGFKHYGKALLLGCVQFLLQTMSYQGGLIVSLFAIVLILRYTLSYHVLADEPEQSPINALARSRYLMTGNKMKLVRLILSFIGWYMLVSFLTTGVQLLRYPAIIDEMNALAEKMGSAGGQSMTAFSALDLPSLKASEKDIVVRIAELIAPLGISVYFNTSLACFYDLASGNMVTSEEPVKEAPQAYSPAVYGNTYPSDSHERRDDDDDEQ